MASKTTLNARNLEALGAERLAVLLIEISTGSATAKRKLKLALTSASSPSELTSEIGKRLTAIAVGRGRIGWARRKTFVADLDMQRRAIVDEVARFDLGGAVELLWRLLDLSGPVFDRCDDTTGVVAAVFEAAREDLGRLALAGGLPWSSLAARTFSLLRADAHGYHDGLVRVLAPALGPVGLEALRLQLLDLLPASGSGKTRREDRWVSGALQQIADVMGDVDSFAALAGPAARRLPGVAAEIATRFLAAGRGEAAMAALEAADLALSGGASSDWEAAQIAVLEALERKDEAQAARLAAFRRTLDPALLRAWLKRLPDFDDVEAEAAILTELAGRRDIHPVLAFLIRWPAVNAAARLVRTRGQELAGDRHELLSPVADALAARHLWEATVVWRTLIEAVLDRGRSQRYAHAARHLADCAGVAPLIEDIADLDSHEDFVARLRARHGRKSAFWDRVSVQL